MVHFQMIQQMLKVDEQSRDLEAVDMDSDEIEFEKIELEVAAAVSKL